MNGLLACIPIACVVSLAAHPVAAGQERPQAPTVLVILDDGASDVERNAGAAFARRVQMAGGADVTVTTETEARGLPAPASHGIVVHAGTASRGEGAARALAERNLTAPEEAEGYVLDVRADAGPTADAFAGVARAALVCGHDARGVLYGLGKLLRLADYSRGFSVPVVSLAEAPAIAERGAYFASHFNNYYERAPVDEVEAYVDDMAFWGFNNIWTWFDMNWYPEDFDRDPQSRGMQLLERVRRVNKRAADFGLTVGLIGVSNEGFKKQPPAELLADMSEKRGGYYPDSTICPSKPGGMDLILANRRKVLELVGPIDVFITWPFDQGSCGCPDCRPWVGKYLEIAPAIAAEVKRTNPDAEFFVSTWYFKDEELGGVRALMEQGADWLQGVLTDTAAPGAFDPPAGYKRLVFPEISMHGSLFTGYGASGANPMPHRFVEEARQAARHGYGAVIYSEGIYEDINKVTWACSLWDPKRGAEDIVEEYAGFYFGRDHLADWTGLILGLETTWPPERLGEADADTVRGLYRTARRLATLAPSNPASRVRWLYLHDRAEMDAKMVEIGSDTELLRQAKTVIDETGYGQDSAGLRQEVQQLRDGVARRAEALEDLFETHWAYLERAHLERTTTLVITPPAFIGQRDWDTLLPVLDRALAETGDEAMRVALLRGFKQWFWHNNISLDFLFL